MAKTSKIRTLITALIVLTGTAYLMISCWKGLSRTYIEDDWNVTQGKILGADAPVEGKEDLARKTEWLEQAINYEYTVDGVKHKSNAVSKEAFVFEDQYPAGKIVDVYYNPADVTDSVLLRSRVQKQYLIALMGFCALMIVVVIVCTIRDLKL